MSDGGRPSHLAFWQDMKQSGKGWNCYSKRVNEREIFKMIYNFYFTFEPSFVHMAVEPSTTYEISHNTHDSSQSNVFW